MGQKFITDFVVVNNISLNSTNYLIVLKASNSLPRIFPGQFVNVEIKNSPDIFLRRPFSIFEVDYEENSLSMIVKILGKGSKKLTEIRRGASLSLIYPLGKYFTYPEKNDKILLIGGGSGVAPMLFLAKECKINSENVDILIGARSIEDHINVEKYQQYGKVHYSTEDGSLGEKGFVTDNSIFKNNLRSFNKIYACGPDGMMKAVASKAKKVGVYCEVSLENLMACGFGVCLCCIEPTNRGNLCVCTEGPVFNVNELKW